MVFLTKRQSHAQALNDVAGALDPPLAVTASSKQPDRLVITQADIQQWCAAHHHLSTTPKEGHDSAVLDILSGRSASERRDGGG